MTDLVDDDLILNSVTYFKYPSTNENVEGFELSKVKTEPEPCDNREGLDHYENHHNEYGSNNDNYNYNYSPYFQNQNQCNFNEQHASYPQFNDFPVKQEIKSEPYSFCPKEPECYPNSISFQNQQYGYQQPQQHHHHHHQQQHHHHQQQQQQQQLHHHHHQQQQQQQQQHHQQQQQQQQQPPQHQLHPRQPQPHHQYQQNGQYWNNWSHSYIDQPCCSPQSNSSSLLGYPDMKSPQTFCDNGGAKKRGRKKKIKMEPEDGLQTGLTSNFNLDMMPLSAAENDASSSEATTPTKPIKERRKHDRFNGMPEEEVSKRTLPDLLASNLDIVIIGINPGLFAAYKGHHYAGPGNHFWKCLYLSGLISEQLTADDDYKLLQCGIGFTNMVERATKGSSDLTRKEIREGGQILLEKLQKYKPKIAVFNGKLIFEVFSGKKEFNFGRQPDFVDSTNTYMWVMPSSSARCAQLPRASDKVPYYAALKKFRDYLNGVVSVLDENDVVFQYCKLKTFPRNNHAVKEEIKIEEEEIEDDEVGSPGQFKCFNEKKKIKAEIVKYESAATMVGDGMIVKKKRGRPKKIRPAEEGTKTMVSMQNQQPHNGLPMFGETNASSLNVANQSQLPTHGPPVSALPALQAPSPVPSTNANTSSASPTAATVSSKYFAAENQSPSYTQSNNFSPSYQQQFSSPGDAGYYSQNSLESAFNAYDFHPSEIQSHLRSFLPSSKLESTCSLND